MPTLRIQPSSRSNPAGRKSKEGRNRSGALRKKTPQEHQTHTAFKPSAFNGFQNGADTRGGEETWQSMYRNLLEPFKADLALLFGRSDNKSASLYSTAKYIWETHEYQDWYDYYCSVCDGNWYNFFQFFNKSGIGGGIRDFKGSGAIIFAFRHILKSNYLEIIHQYDRIIVTRSDFFYINEHPVVSNDRFWAVEGEDYGGITDRHHIFPASFAEKALGVVEYIDDPETMNRIFNDWKQRPIHVNPEYILEQCLIHNGIDIKSRVKRVQFTVGIETDNTRWKTLGPYMPGSKSIRLKYVSEYIQAIQNCLRSKE